MTSVETNVEVESMTKIPVAVRLFLIVALVIAWFASLITILQIIIQSVGVLMAILLLSATYVVLPAAIFWLLTSIQKS